MLAPRFSTPRGSDVYRQLTGCGSLSGGGGEGRWIVSGDVNLEHTLEVFTTINPGEDVWDSCDAPVDHLLTNHNSPFLDQK